jgi:hypothetical protein
MLSQLVYISAAAHPFSSDELTSLLAKSRLNNAAQNITGMLLYHGGSFLQAIEGEEKAVGDLYRRISQDVRHTHIEMLLKWYVPKRSFGDWAMGFAHSSAEAFKKLPGFRDFFNGTLNAQAFAADPSAAHRLLLEFRTGRWRQIVETATPQLAGVN